MQVQRAELVHADHLPIRGLVVVELQDAGQFTPSNASWLNGIECEFTALRYFTLLDMVKQYVDRNLGTRR